jgi:peptide subunit release factor 1 (eRF1)
VFSDSYLTRNLVAAKAQAAPFWLVVVSAEKAELWRGVDGVLHPHTDQGFPLTPEPVQSDPERLERIGDTPSVYQDETTRGFLRRVDDAVAKLLGEEPLPYFLVGPAAALTQLAHRAGKGQQPAGKLAKSGLVGATPAVLAEEIKPMLAEYGQRRTQEVLGRLDQAMGRKTFAAGLDEIWESVSTGRVELLAVEEDFRLTARMDRGHLVPLLDGEVGPDVREDVVDEIVETALNTDAEVVFVPNGTLDQHQHMAAVLRY